MPAPLFETTPPPLFETTPPPLFETMPPPLSEISVAGARRVPKRVAREVSTV
jgi:hypothetical protein